MRDRHDAAPVVYVAGAERRTIARLRADPFRGRFRYLAEPDLALGSARAESPSGKALREMAVKSRLRVVHENRDVHPVRDFELGEKTRDVRFDGGLAHEQRCGNLGVGCAGPSASSVANWARAGP